MKCRVCGSTMATVVTDLPFKTSATTIVILKNLPVEQCGHCSEYSLGDGVMAQVDELLAQVTPQAELEILRYEAA